MSEYIGKVNDKEQIGKLKEFNSTDIWFEFTHNGKTYFIPNKVGEK